MCHREPRVHSFTNNRSRCNLFPIPSSALMAVQHKQPPLTCRYFDHARDDLKNNQNEKGHLLMSQNLHQAYVRIGSLSKRTHMLVLFRTLHSTLIPDPVLSSRPRRSCSDSEGDELVLDGFTRNGLKQTWSEPSPPAGIDRLLTSSVKPQQQQQQRAASSGS
ncbi:hypothetical protein EYF80_006827 [Liparis tanakae]|uniref:Uncharacterized protein n=1 Tax=Liparis tanakae TaxID=230148 RepID=A0A4Z2IY01_9TELE|nr:hypothetical protein EYF80_006827 [Liparis tanakae]